MDRKLGVWIFGARGAVATCSMVGAAAIRRGLAPPIGMLTETPTCASLDLAPVAGLAFGGHDIRARPDLSTEAVARRFHETNGVPPLAVIEGVKDDLAAVDPWVRPGTAVGSGEAIGRLIETPPLEASMGAAQIVECLAEDMRAFQAQSGLDALVAVNLASTEPYAGSARPEHASLAALETAIREDRWEALSAGVLYAYAAIGASIPFINFTPSPAAEVPAIEELSRLRGVPYAGKDGKTGETLVKTCLAPMFVARALEVMTWESHNILGGGDGAVLALPVNNRAKSVGKDAALRALLGDPPGLTSRVRIDYTPSLGDWKTAWNFIHFRGFLGTKMSMQFIWQGCDSMLAAPLVLDLVRLVDHAARRGFTGRLDHLACFFKSHGPDLTHDFYKQMAKLEAYIAADHHSPDSVDHATGGKRIASS